MNDQEQNAGEVGKTRAQGFVIAAFILVIISIFSLLAPREFGLRPSYSLLLSILSFVFATIGITEGVRGSKMRLYAVIILVVAALAITGSWIAQHSQLEKMRPGKKGERIFAPKKGMMMRGAEEDYAPAPPADGFCAPDGLPPSR